MKSLSPDPKSADATNGIGIRTGQSLCMELREYETMAKKLNINHAIDYPSSMNGLLIVGKDVAGLGAVL